MIVSGFSGNEMYCLAQKGWAPGSIVVGNPVFGIPSELLWTANAGQTWHPVRF